MPKRISLLIASILWLSMLSGQASEQTELALGDAYQMLDNRYPSLRNAALTLEIQQRQQLQIQAEAKPGLYWKADGRLQSESVNLDAGESMLPFEINRPIVSAQTYLEANYLWLDGGINEARQQLSASKAAADLQQLEIERFGLRESVNRLFFSISSLRAQQDLFDLALADIQSRKEQVKAGVEYGVLLESELTKLIVREEELLAQQDDIQFRERGALRSLEQLLGTKLSEEVNLIYPELSTPENIPPIKRPEQEWFRLQKETMLAQNQLIDSESRPKLHLFAQAGVGYPNPLNLLDSNPAPYGIVGAGFSWRLTDWDKNSLQKEILSLQALQLENKKEAFDFNLQQQEAQYLAEIERLQIQMVRDERIAKLQAEILVQSAAQLEEGVITAADYINQLNAELRARQQLAVHQIQLQQTQLSFWNARGGF